MFFLDDGEGIIHKPFPDCRGDGAVARALVFKVFHKQVSHYRAYGRPHSSPFDLFIHLSLEGKVGGSETKFKQIGDLFHCHGCSLVQVFVFFQVLLYYGYYWFYYWH